MGDFWATLTNFGVGKAIACVVLLIIIGAAFMALGGGNKGGNNGGNNSNNTNTTHTNNTTNRNNTNGTGGVS